MTDFTRKIHWYFAKKFPGHFVQGPGCREYDRGDHGPPLPRRKGTAGDKPPPYGFGLAATAAVIVVAAAALVAAAVAQQQNQDDDPPPVVVQASAKAVVITHIHTLRKQS